MASTQIDVLAILTPAPEKAEVLLKSLNEVATWIKDNEPGTLKYEIFHDAKKNEVILIERYADSAALKAHGGSEKFKAFNQAVKKEQLLSKPLELKFIRSVGGLSRM